MSLSGGLILLFAILIQFHYIVDCGVFNCSEPNQCVDEIYICEPNEHCFIECTGSNACNSAKFICPSNDFDCNVNCNGANNMAMNGGCWQTIFDASESNYVNLYITATNKPNILENASILCPLNGDCIVECDGFEGCKGITIIASHSTNMVSVKAINGGQSVLQNANITCPDHSHQTYQETNCLIQTIAQNENDKHQIQNMVIYSVESLKNMNISCFDIDNEALLFCTADYNESCNIKLINNEWQCIDKNNKCNNYLHPMSTVDNIVFNKQAADNMEKSQFVVDMILRIGIAIILFFCVLVLLSSICLLQQKRVKQKMKDEIMKEIIIKVNESKMNVNESINHDDTTSPVSCTEIISSILNKEMSPSASPSIIYQQENIHQYKARITTNINVNDAKLHVPNAMSTETVDVEELYEAKTISNNTIDNKMINEYRKATIDDSGEV